MRNGVSNNQIKALTIAMAGASVAAVATMFIPATALESFTGSTGISELVPAAAAPLGDTARAMIAFAVGALTLALLGYLLPRQSKELRATVFGLTPHSIDEPQTATSLKDRMAAIAWPKMPWAKDDDDITDLSDLPKLRFGDAHPDAPPRRPLSAHQDLPALELNKVATPLVKEIVAEPSHDFAGAIPEFQPTNDTPDPVAAVGDVQPTLAEMVAQLEAAVAERQKQLADLEVVAAQLTAGREEPVVAEPEEETTSDPEAIVEPARSERPALEVVPPSPVEEDDMDIALAAALATLHRMNGTGR